MHYVDQNPDVFPVELGAPERKIMRDALNLLEDGLEKAQKRDKELGAPNAVIALHLSVINGDSGWGQGLYTKLSEQVSLDEEARATQAASAEQRDVDTTRDALLFAAFNLDLDPKIVGGWSADDRKAVREWAYAWSARGRDDRDPTILPPGMPYALLDALIPIARLEMELALGAAANDASSDTSEEVAAEPAAAGA